MEKDSTIIFITGGVRSGKSRFAEQTAIQLHQAYKGSQLHYIAAMQSSDAEMKERIFHHQSERFQSGYHWKTWEQPVSIGELESQFSSDDIVLLDCLTTWLNNELFSNHNWQDPLVQNELFNKMREGILLISQKVKTLIIVSNEVLNEPISNQELVFFYCKMLGELHQMIAYHAHQAFLVEAGIPVLMKGDIGCME